jgi:hypothetical protein
VRRPFAVLPRLLFLGADATVDSTEPAPVAASDDSRLFGLVNSLKIAVIPTRTNSYAIDLGKVKRDRLRWDAMSKAPSTAMPMVLPCYRDLAPSLPKATLRACRSDSVRACSGDRRRHAPTDPIALAAHVCGNRHPEGIRP